MPGGSPDAWPAIKEIFQKTSAQVQGDPCADWMGESGAGHYVKMVHNGSYSSAHTVRSSVYMIAF
jgi:6-phosphogluconate dehydrogenase